MEVKERILAGAAELFMRYGCKSVTMDDIARHLAVSKKTLYQFYKDKDEIITTFARNEFECEKDCMQGITADAENAIDEVMRISRHIRQTFSKMNPALLYEMQKYHVEAWQVYADFRESAVADHIRGNLERGIREGLYRDTIDVEILTRLRLELIQLAFDPRVFPPAQFSLVEIQMQVMDLFIRGIATTKGLQVLDQYKTKYFTHLPS
ncbi:MAG: TetR/AcrR family transcriptional regulator [Cytophagales bacterium]|nr:TetR/AcrR family transcriptional regulator [Cytophagales bacterium]